MKNPRRGTSWVPGNFSEVLDAKRASLLELDRRALLLELLLELLGVFLAEVLLDDLRSAFDQVLGFLEAQARGRADDLDDLDLLVAGGFEDDVKGALGRLNFGRSGAASTRAGHHHRSARGGLDAMLVLQVPGQIDRLLEGQTDDLVAELLDVFCYLCHDFISEPYRGSTVSNLSSRTRTAFTANAFN